MSTETLHQAYGESSEPRYDVPDEEISTITHNALASMDHPRGRFVTMVVTDGPMADVARTVERRVFEESFDNDTSEMKAEYGEYDLAGSRKFLVVVDTENKKPAGVMGILENSPIGLKSLNDAAKPENVGIPALYLKLTCGIEDMDRCWDVGTLAVMPEYRGKQSALQVSTQLYRMLFKLGEQEGITDLVAIIDSRAKKNIDALGVPFKPMANSRAFEYLGSPESYAVHGKLAEFQPAVAKRARVLKRLAAVATSVSHLVGMEKNRKVERLSMAAQIAGALATGRTIDSQLMLPE